jgi:hypothetical protein
MLTKTREYIDFWVENSVHAAENTGHEALPKAWTYWLSASLMGPRIKASVSTR